MMEPRMLMTYYYRFCVWQNMLVSHLHFLSKVRNMSFIMGNLLSFFMYANNVLPTPIQI